LFSGLIGFLENLDVESGLSALFASAVFGDGFSIGSLTIWFEEREA
jgi:hypothetical protein